MQQLGCKWGIMIEATAALELRTGTGVRYCYETVVRHTDERTTLLLIAALLCEREKASAWRYAEGLLQV